MTYALLNLLVLAVLAIVLVPRLRGLRRGPLVWTAAIMVLLTVVFDNVIISAGLVAYGPDEILGLRVGVAPIEDFAYTLAAVLLMPAVWTTFANRASRLRRHPMDLPDPPDPAAR